MAAERSRRNNAGNRMRKLIEEQVEEDESDDVYKTLYGGFNEEDDDDDYVEEEPEEDIVDSDFSLSEKEDEGEAESDDEKKKRKRAKKKIKLSKSLNAPPKPRKPTVKKVIKPILLPEKGARMRATTLLKSHQIAAKKNLQNTIRRHPTIPQMRRLTQEELLAEARITEEKNLASLAQFLKIEAEKKAAKSVKVRYQGPIIRFQSVRMPPTANENEPCSRNFLEFTDTKNFPKEYFPAKNLQPPSKPVCVVTGLPAKYKDPMTGLPYATIAAFKYIRQHRKRLKEELAAKRESKRKKK